MQKLQKAIDELKNNTEYCCICIKDSSISRAKGIGVKPLIGWLREDPNFFEGCVVADKVIGRAAAFLLVLGKASEVYGAIMSQGAADVLKQYGIDFQYGEIVPFIVNRTNTGMCPLEKAVCGIEAPELAYAAIQKEIENLMGNSIS